MVAAKLPPPRRATGRHLGSRIIHAAAPDRGATWKGKAVELLIAAHCVLISDGRLNVSIPMVDDAGVDLVFSLRDRPQTLAVQVKSRFSTAKRVSSGGFRIGVRRPTFKARADLAVLYDVAHAEAAMTWLIPSLKFAELTKDQSPSRRLLVMAARIAGKSNKWFPYRSEMRDLPKRIESILKELGAG